MIFVYDHIIIAQLHTSQTNSNNPPQILKQPPQIASITSKKTLESSSPIHIKKTSHAIYHPDGYIIGNPLLDSECSAAITNSIPSGLIQSFPSILSDIHKQWFVSRESYSTYFSHSHHQQHYKIGHSKRNNMQYHSKTKICTSLKNGFNTSSSTSYFNIEKSASSTTSSYLKRQADELEFTQTYVENNALIISNCTFTFVRDPLQRFISAYYTINRLMWDVEHNPGYPNDKIHIAHLRNIFKFLSIEGEPERFQAYVDDLSIFESVMIFASRHLQHMMSQTAILSLANISLLGTNNGWFTDPQNNNNNDNRFFIGKVEQYEDHWNRLTEICDDIVEYQKELQLMPSYGARTTLNKTYLKVMSLDKWKKGDILPAYFALDDITFAKIVNYFYQDYVCFGYEPKLPDFLVNYQEK